MNILYIAYSCSPYSGSEDKIGWSVPFESAKNNRVVVITKEEQRADVEDFFQKHPATNIDVHYVDIPRVYKKVFKGFLYSARLNLWHRRALAFARKYCAQHPVDIIHQITPVEFRAVGDYFRIPDIKFVCGPLGGGESIPRGLKGYAKGHRMVEIIRGIVNRWCRFSMRLSGKMDRCDAVIFANQETRSYLSGISHRCKNAELFSEIGLRTDELKENNSVKHAVSKCRFLSAGRMIYRKGYDLLLDALEQLPNDLDYEFCILGDGPELVRLRNRCAGSEKLERYVTFMGAVPYEKMEEAYCNADVFVMPSIRETTGTVLLEAMAKGLPIITIDGFGGALLLDEHSGWLNQGHDKSSFVDAMRNALETCIRKPEDVTRKGRAARLAADNHTWGQKMQYYQEIYIQIIDKREG